MEAASYSQHGEDRLVAEHFEWRRSGYFVEVGALDGVTFSNTCLLERAYGWRGCLIEADPRQASTARLNRPDAQVVACAVTSPDQAGSNLPFHVVEGYEALSTLSVAPRTQALIERMNTEAGLECSVTSAVVETSTLDSILEGVQAPPDIDFLSMDIEGHEWPALQGFSLGSKWLVSVLLIESNTTFPDLRIVRYLTRRRYAFIRSVGGINHWYEPRNGLIVALRLPRLYTECAVRPLRRGLVAVLERAHLLHAIKRLIGRTG